MTLSEYMKSNGLSDADMATCLGCSQGAIRKWRYGERMPRPDQMRIIADVTAGAVTANDFMLAPIDPDPLARAAITPPRPDA